MFTFSNNHSAGVCDLNAGFFEADTSRLNMREEMAGPFDDGFVSFKVAKDGSGVVPYLPGDYSSASGQHSVIRFHQIWFSSKKPETCDISGIECLNCCNAEQNFFHVMGLEKSESLSRAGTSHSNSDVSWIFTQAIFDLCEGCSVQERSNFVSHTTNHEIGHQFKVNCPNPTPPPTNGHDLNEAWCGLCDGGNLPRCLMHSDNEPISNKIDGIDRFCCYNLLADVKVCSADETKCGEGVRVTTDPK